MTQPSTITVYEAARQLSVTIDYVYKLIWAGKIAATKIDGKWHIEYPITRSK